MYICVYKSYSSPFISSLLSLSFFPKTCSHIHIIFCLFLKVVFRKNSWSKCQADTFLKIAANMDYVDVVKLLLNNGADIDFSGEVSKYTVI